MAHWFLSLQRLAQGIGSSFTPQRSRLLNDPYYRFQSLSELQWAAQLGIRIDANRATVDDWLRLPGLSIHQARTLVCLRQSGVLFYSLEDVAAALSLPLERLQPLTPILLFCHYDPTSGVTIQPVNANLASVTTLIRVPQVDLYLARAIVENRDRQGNYTSMADLQQRLTLSPALTATLMHYLVF